MIKKHASKFLLLLTAVGLIVGFFIVVIIEPTAHLEAIPLYTQGQPTLGDPSAKVQIVVFEDPKCNNCINYHRETFSLLKKDFIDTGKVRYTVYLVSGLKQSATISNFLFCINQQSTTAFFEFLDDFYKTPPLGITDQEIITEMTKAVKLLKLSVDMEKLTRCADAHSFSQKVLDNTNYARAIMGGVIKTPTVFVNGIKITRPSYRELKKVIQQELKK